MKYAKVISLVEREYGRKQYKLKFLQYKTLKKLMKDVNSQETFFQLLNENILQIKRDFALLSKKVLSDYNRHHSGFQRCMGLVSMSVSQQISYNAFQCLRYAHVNTAGLRKIVKKFDKEYRSTQGKAVLQKVWADNDMDNFLHSPILWELAAIYKLGERSGTRMTVETGDSFWQAVPEIIDDLDVADQLHTLSIVYIDELQWTCPICLCLLYHPVAFGCGHKFCLDCAVAALNKGELASRPLRFLKSLSEDEQCPECRQAAVSKKLMLLKLLNQAIKIKFPKEYQQRQRQNRSDKSEQLRKRMQEHVSQWGGHTIHPHALVLSM